MTSTPAWYRAFTTTERPPSGKWHPADPPPWWTMLTDAPRAAAGDGGEWGFLGLVEPLVREAYARLWQGLDDLAGRYGTLPFTRQTVTDLLFRDLSEKASSILGRTMVLELNVARVEGALAGTSPEERFRSFKERLRRPDVQRALFEEYPVLGRQLVTAVEQWLDVSRELLDRLCADHTALIDAFAAGSDPGPLVGLGGGLGDTHRGGRSVRKLTFASGLEVIYKPRPLAGELHFQELLGWLNARGATPPLRTIRILDRGAYGWAECVLPAPCRSPEEIRRFYERQGGFLALFYALKATDFHFENVIAAGEHPVPIDLETLFHPPLPDIAQGSATLLAAHTISESLVGTGLAPHRMWVTADADGVDLSGVGSSPGQLTPFSVPVWDGEATDEMRLTRKALPIGDRQNRPTLDGSDVDVLAYTDAIVAGFERTWRLLAAHAHALTAEGGPIARFIDDEMRIIVRPTQTYSALLRESYHPDLLRDALDRDRHFDLLRAPVEYVPYLHAVIPHELAQLEQGDVPAFTARPGSRDLWSAAGERIPEFFAESGMDVARRTLATLGEEHLARQRWFLRASLVTLARGADDLPWTSYALPARPVPATRDALLAAARAVGDRLDALAVHGDASTSWIGLRPASDDRWMLVPLSLDLYDGLPGVILFLAHLGEVTGETRYRRLAERGLVALREVVDWERAALTSVGAFTGIGGLVYLLAHLSTLWRRPDLAAEARGLVDLVPALVERDEELDVVGGAAGCIMALASLERREPSAAVRAAMVRCAERLLARAQPMEHGWGWVTRHAPVPLSGYSHGAAGIAAALLEVAAVSGQERFRAAALHALAYERSLFAPGERNWRDLRVLPGPPQEQDPSFHVAWCHGAPGVGLARLRSLSYLDDQAVRAEIDTAVDTTLARGFGRNHCLCHGDLGNLELLLEASRTLPQRHHPARVEHVSAVVLDSMRTHGFLCGVPMGVESPGLMTGLAGIGYGLLRLAEPGRVPSVLTLAPPVEDA